MGVAALLRREQLTLHVYAVGDLKPHLAAFVQGLQRAWEEARTSTPPRPAAAVHGG